MDKPSSIARCFTSRRSNESQCPMLSRFTSSKSNHNHKQHNKKQSKNLIIEPQRKPSSKTSAAANLLASLKSSSNHSNNSPSNTSAVVHAVNTNQKKLRFQLAKERKASTTLGIIMSAFTFCWLPFFVLALVRPFLSDHENAIPHTLSSLFLWLGYANSLLNPIIYATLNRDFRKPFQEILYFRCGSLNHMMREEFYHSQYGDPEQTFCGNVVMTTTQTYRTTPTGTAAVVTATTTTTSGGVALTCRGDGGGSGSHNNSQSDGSGGGAKVGVVSGGSDEHDCDAEDDYDEEIAAVEYIEADGESNIKSLDIMLTDDTAAHESFL